MLSYICHYIFTQITVNHNGLIGPNGDLVPRLAVKELKNVTDAAINKDPVNNAQENHLKLDLVSAR